MENIQKDLLTRIKLTVSEIWLDLIMYKNLSSKFRYIFQSLSDFNKFVLSLVCNIDRINDDNIKKAIIDLSEMNKNDIVGSDLIIKNVILKYFNIERFSSNEDIEFIEYKLIIVKREIDKLFEEIKKANSLKKAMSDLNILNQLSIITAKFKFKNKVRLPDELYRFILRFEHEDEEIENIYKDIKNDTLLKREIDHGV